MEVRVSAGLAFAVIAMAGCSATDNGGSDAKRSVTTVAVPALPVAPAEARAVIEDWYVDGLFNSPHRCAAVRAAIERLPTGGRDHFTVYDDMRSLERRTCG